MKSFFRKITEGFKKTRAVVADGIQQVFQQYREIAPELYDDLEAVLLRGDVGPQTAADLIARLKQKAKDERIEDPAALRRALHEIVQEILEGANAGSAPPVFSDTGLASGPPAATGAPGKAAGARESPAGARPPSAGAGDPSAGARAPSADPGAAAATPAPGDPWVVLIAGVNGVGKTTSLAKLAWRAQQAGRVPLIVASDTFRAAASEQLEVWARRLDLHMVKSQTGADPGAVAFDGIRSARARGADLVLVDTAGRLQTKGNLMEELKKIHRVCGKALPGAPHETILVLDATIGQNAISQARLFSQAVPIDGILLAKLDGTSKGGVILGIAHELRIPVRYAGVGEKAEDLIDFDPSLFARELVGEAVPDEDPE